MRRVAIVGATGAVGQELCRVLQRRQFETGEVRLFASPRSVGRTVEGVRGPATVAALGPEAFAGVDVAFFSAGGAVSREYALQAREAGALVIDNSSAFRLDNDVPLVVPEVNPETLRHHRGIIANPNCSTIILAVVLWPLRQLGTIRRVVVSTYQAVSGAGARGLAELEVQTRAVLAGEAPRPEVFPVPCAFNVFSHNSPVDADGLNLEERKLILETCKIFGDNELRIAPTCMRVPVMRAHTESVTVEFDQPVTVERARALLYRAPGLRLVDDPAADRFPTPLDAANVDDVLVGRVRHDPSVRDERGLQLICSGDQLLKGAALNAVQIAELAAGGS